MGGGEFRKQAMATEYSNVNRGVLFVNDRKAQGSNQADRTGTLNVEGVEYFLDGWLKESAGGKKFMSVSIKRKDKQPEPPQGQPQQRQAPQQARQQPPSAPQRSSNSGFDDMDDGIPFRDPLSHPGAHLAL